MREESSKGEDEDRNLKTLEISSKEEVDVLSKCIRDGTAGQGLISVVAVSTCMAIISVALIIQYHYEPSLDDVPATSHQQCNAVVAASRSSSSSASPFPLWADLLAQQIQIIQNLVHASLLGGAGFVAAYRGDVVWLYFARNCCFYFGLAALSYFAVDLWKEAFGTTMIVSVVMGSCCIVAFVRLEIVRCQVLRLVEQYTQGHEAKFPKYLPSTRPQVVKTAIIARLADCLQGTTIVFTILTTVTAIIDVDCLSETSVGLLEMSYAQGAHRAFLLSLLFLVTTFPGDQSCVGGAIICSGWRLTLALSYLVQLVNPKTLSDRQIISVFSSSMEVLLMLPIFVTTLLLRRENSASDLWTTKSGAPKYTRVEDDDESESEGDSVSDSPDLDQFRQIESLSMRQISKSEHFSVRQRRGAFLVWISSGCLLFEMTFECLMLLQYSTVVAGFGGEVYQWGMHVCAMYLFCAHMSVNSSHVYERARWLMAIACPGGTAIACWQIWILCSSNVDDFDRQTKAAMVLFLIRALCGIFQCVGISLLTTTEPEIDFIASEVGASVELERRLQRSSFILYYVFIPCLFLAIVEEAYSASCSEPFLSPTTPECVHDFYLLALTWPGLGTFFHFGGLLVIFASDSLLYASYPPSLAIATLFAGQLFALLVGHLAIILALVKSSFGMLQLVLNVVRMLSTGLLWFSLHGLWKWRVLETP